MELDPVRLGRMESRVVVAASGPFRPEQIESRYSAVEPTYPPEIEEALAKLGEDLRQRAAAGEAVPYDSDGFKLIGFRVAGSSGRLILDFGPTTYFRMLATNRQDLRERYARSADLRTAPVAELASFWSIGVSIVTADGRLLVSERGDTALDPHVCGPAVGEGATRGVDDGPNGAPDQFMVARRGLEEELGLELRPDALTWLSLSADTIAYDYALIGRVDLPLTVDAVEERHASAAPADAWDTKRLHAVEFSPDAVARFCLAPDRRFSPFGLATVVQTLVHEFGVARTEAALRS